MNRRNLLAAGVVSLVAVQMPEPASAAQTATQEVTPIQHTLHLHRNLQDFLAPHIQAGGWLTDGSQMQASLMFDQLLGYMMEQFGHLPCAPSDWIEVGHKRSNFTEADLHNMTPGVIPLLVASSITRSTRSSCGVPPMRYVTNWRRFLNLYRQHIEHAWNHMLNNESKSG